MSEYETTAFLQSLVKRTERLEIQLNAIGLVLSDHGYSICAQRECSTYVVRDIGHIVDGKQYCDMCYPSAHDRYTKVIVRNLREADAEKEEPIEYRSAPVWAWDIIDEALGIDAVIDASDKELRTEIQRAINAMIAWTAWNRYHLR